MTSSDVAIDASSADREAAAPACNLTQLFGTPVLLSGPINGVGNTNALWLSPDWLSAYFQSNRADAGVSFYSIYFANRNGVDAAFGAIAPSVNLNAVATGYGNQVPVVTDDGKTIYFFTGTTGGYTAWTSTRNTTAVDFDPPTVLPQPVNQQGTESMPAWITPDGGTLYFSTNRGGTRDIYVATRTGNGGFGTPTALLAVNSSGSEVGIVLSADELQAVVTRGAKLFYTSRPSNSSSFATPTAIAELNSFGAPLAASWLTADGCTLYFQGPIGDGGTNGVYMATRGP